MAYHIYWTLALFLYKLMYREDRQLYFAVVPPDQSVPQLPEEWAQL